MLIFNRLWAQERKAEKDNLRFVPKCESFEDFKFQRIFDRN